jgi:DNA primase
MLDQRFLDELRTRTLLSALIGRTLKLQRAGREFKACCPFHNEKTPSFYVNDEKGFFHCFGCSAHGDAIRWLTDARGLPFMDAIKELADAAGMEVPAPDLRAQEKAERAVGLFEIMEAAAGWFAEQLAGIEGDAARNYLRERGIDVTTQTRFGLGFAPDARGKLKAALKKFGSDKLIEAGLLIQPEGDREPYDRFRGRLMFPIRDTRGRCIAFSGRIVGSGEPKYLNSPDTPLFDKGRTLFNIDKAGPASRTQKRLIVVEGQMDVLALHQAGFPEAVAPLGTALTETQLEQLWRLSNKPLLCFDGDNPGQKAAARAARRALPLVRSGHTLGFIPLPPGKDPDDLIRSGGSAALTAFLARPEELVQRLWRAEIEESDLSTPEGRAGVNQRLSDLASTIQDPFVRDEYKRTFREMFWEQFGWRKREVQQVSSEITASRKAGRDFTRVLNRAILLGLSRYPDVLREEMEHALSLDLSDDHQRQWLGVILDAVIERTDLNEDLLVQILETSVVPPIEQRDLTKDLAFSFFYRREPERGRSDLREVLATVAAEREVAKALAMANEQFAKVVETPEWEQQQRLLAEKKTLQERLSAFVERVASEREDTQKERQSA